MKGSLPNRVFPFAWWWEDPLPRPPSPPACGRGTATQRRCRPPIDASRVRRPWLRAAGALGVRAALLTLVLAAYAFLTPLAINLVHGTAFISAEYEASAGAIGGARDQLETMNLEMETELPAEPGETACEGVAGCLESLGGSVSALSRKLGDYSALGQRYQGYIDEATALADRISRQVVVQIAVFVLETLVIPLAGLWLAGLAIRGLVRF